MGNVNHSLYAGFLKEVDFITDQLILFYIAHRENIEIQKILKNAVPFISRTSNK